LAALDDMLATLRIEAVAEEVLAHLASPCPAEALSTVGGQVAVEVRMVLSRDRHSDLSSAQFLPTFVALLRHTLSSCSLLVAQPPLSDFLTEFFVEEAFLDLFVCFEIFCSPLLASSYLRLHLCRLSANSSPTLIQVTSSYSPM
jgi:hypothetical protein